MDTIRANLIRRKIKSSSMQTVNRLDQHHHGYATFGASDSSIDSISSNSRTVAGEPPLPSIGNRPHKLPQYAPFGSSDSSPMGSISSNSLTANEAPPLPIKGSRVHKHRQDDAHFGSSDSSSMGSISSSSPTVNEAPPLPMVGNRLYKYRQDNYASFGSSVSSFMGSISSNSLTVDGAPPLHSAGTAAFDINTPSSGFSSGSSSDENPPVMHRSVSRRGRSVKVMVIC